MKGKIEVNVHEGNVWIDVTGEVAMYPGDRGTVVCNTVIMTPSQLKSLVSTLIHAWRKLKDNT